MFTLPTVEAKLRIQPTEQEAADISFCNPLYNNSLSCNMTHANPTGESSSSYVVQNKFLWSKNAHMLLQRWYVRILKLK